MPDKSSRVFGFDRISLAAAMPVVSTALALGMAALYLAVSLIASNIEASQRCEMEARRVGALLEAELARGGLEAVEAILAAYAPTPLRLESLAGEIMAANADAEGARFVHTVTIEVNGETVAQLQAGAFATGGLPIPLYGIALLVLLACGLAYGCSHFFAGVVIRSVQSVQQDADRLRRGDRSELEVDVTSRFVELRGLHIAMRRAVHAVMREAAELRDVAYRNPQTGLPNMGALTRMLDRELVVADFNNPLALFCLDLDHFDRACENFGSDVGDALLLESVRRVRAEVASLGSVGTLDAGSVMLAQPWSDTMFLVVPGISSRGDASAVARALRSAFVAPLVVGGCEITLGLSGGIALAPEDASSRVDLIRRAETALRTLRDEKKRGFRFYAPRLDRVAQGRMQIETDIRDAIANREFVPHFQPKIDLQTGRIRGCEALARWTRPGGRPISPATFIPVAEESGLIEQIGAQILEASCETAASWLRQGHAVSVAVNVSPLQLRNPAFRSNVLSALTRSGLPPAYLELEITESVAVEDPDSFRDMLNPLKAIGVRLAVDDFGTGHSNLATLSQLNFDVFKIDRQFIQKLGSDGNSRPIVEMILAMAESLGLETVAEGVETAEHARFLRTRGCTYAQGFLYSPALPAEDFIEFLERWEADRNRGLEAAALA